MCEWEAPLGPDGRLLPHKTPISEECGGRIPYRNKVKIRRERSARRALNRHDPGCTALYVAYLDGREVGRWVNDAGIAFGHSLPIIGYRQWRLVITSTKDGRL
jgi:hypothetical protein